MTNHKFKSYSFDTQRVALPPSGAAPGCHVLVLGVFSSPSFRNLTGLRATLALALALCVLELSPPAAPAFNFELRNEAKSQKSRLD